MHIGPTAAPYAFYLPNVPLFPDNWHIEQDNAIAELIALNGNHWRKIFTIMAKICAYGEDWRHYRDNLLLKKHQMLLIGADSLSPHASIHLICGQTAATSLGIAIDSDIASTGQQAAQHLLQASQGKLQDITTKVLTQSPHSSFVLLTPYLDYRQYSNALITLTRAHLQAGHN
ncbi:hypothetical protein [Shewanella sp. CG12_big_fil_rev_8_21_14_0_65_47_15]|uniref:DUF6942 family protein n=1 Tax=Shewanella sp. CG12_big_fil_rev_8_21_14_0_65_47_15 TaxID=1975537 RepID=UPI000CC3CDB9|nr:hypothetical protein [Shewanella sp. CG12_big_fil_rev_8_21_14_0_65_47_15]PIW59161.1 MAG: hypothetical protein COW15_18880 [Shewanella sp. CG12_big_fil_rev_8_21_14_0_65_47_15]